MSFELLTISYLELLPIDKGKDFVRFVFNIRHPNLKNESQTITGSFISMTPRPVFTKHLFNLLLSVIWIGYLSDKAKWFFMLIPLN